MKAKRNDPQIGQIRQIFQKETRAYLSGSDAPNNKSLGDTK